MPRRGRDMFMVGRNSVLASIDGALARFHAAFMARHPFGSIVAATASYSAVILLAGTRLGISGNYFVLLPLLAAAIAYKLPGGIIAGFLGLPANLALFALIGHPEYSPESKLIAELSGIVVGTVLGYLADYFQKLGEEVERRAAIEETLRRALSEKEFLLREVHHRVRNNLTVIKSLVQLQRSRSDDPRYVAAMDDLLFRVFAIAQAHEHLLAPEETPRLDLRAYLPELALSIAKGAQLGIAGQPRLEIEAGPEPVLATPEFATPIGLFLNEAMQNSLRHAWTTADSPRLRIGLAPLGGGLWALSVEDNGRGLPAEFEEKLGFRMMRALATQVDGEASFGPAAGPGADGQDARGTRVELRFRLPVTPRP